jgi:hypothetical protein
MFQTIDLSGPVTDVSFERASDWRRYVAEAFPCT